MERAERLRGGMWGLLVGDALGVPYEFHRPEELPEASLIEMTPPASFSRSHEGVPPGTWSDDGAQALCLLASLLHKGALDPTDLGNRLVNWYECGYLAVDNEVFDVGVQTGRALRAIRGGTSAVRAGPASEWDNGNGSLMRVLPLALWHQGTDEELVRDACLQSLVTHGHRRAQLCCATYCLWARRTLDGEPEAWNAAVEAIEKTCGGDALELEAHLRLRSAPGGSGSGYVVDCLHSARLACKEATFEGVVKAAIRLGNDTDTTAAVAGGIAGIRVGLGGLPGRFVDALRGRELAQPLIERLVAHATSG